uniref:Ribonuclease n=1 Tax=Macrostomum lignano TaxID=282301 RepID=A0A1I8G1C1_9PLAT
MSDEQSDEEAVNREAAILDPRLADSGRDSAQDNESQPVTSAAQAEAASGTAQDIQSRSGSRRGDAANRVAILVPAEDSGHISESFPDSSPLGTNPRSSQSARDDRSPPGTPPKSSREVQDT